MGFQAFHSSTLAAMVTFQCQQLSQFYITFTYPESPSHPPYKFQHKNMSTLFEIQHNTLNATRMCQCCNEFPLLFNIHNVWITAHQTLPFKQPVCKVTWHRVQNNNIINIKLQEEPTSQRFSDKRACPSATYTHYYNLTSSRSIYNNKNQDFFDNRTKCRKILPKWPLP